MAVTTLLADNAVLCSGSQVEKPVDPDKTGGEQPTTGLLRNLRPSSGAGAREALVPASLPAGDGSPVKPLEDEKRFGPCLSKPAGQPPNSITVLSPAVFSKAVQIIPSPPRGKLPILPYSKMKGTLLPVAKPSPKCAGLPAGPLGPTEAVHQKQPPSLARQNSSAAKSAGLLGMGLSASPKPAGKKRGRKRKTMEDILAFEAKKKRSLSFFRRRVPEKPAPASATSVTPGTGPKDRAVDISKKYRSIRPKPVLVMETLPRLVGLPALPAPECLEQEILVAHQVPGKPQDGQRLEQATVRPGLPRPSGAGPGRGRRLRLSGQPAAAPLPHLRPLLPVQAPPPEPHEQPHQQPALRLPHVPQDLRPLGQPQHPHEAAPRRGLAPPDPALRVLRKGLRLRGRVLQPPEGGAQGHPDGGALHQPARGGRTSSELGTSRRGRAGGGGPRGAADQVRPLPGHHSHVRRHEAAPPVRARRGGAGPSEGGGAAGGPRGRGRAGQARRPLLEAAEREAQHGQVRELRGGVLLLLQAQETRSLPPPGGAGDRHAGQRCGGGRESR
ncbi:hypothetical protein ANANG_G00082950 [Anguilla anguilla]|uniref:Uncharacterized protein n=1 Tax=Anguilla anguilla TaxID=7936 RepID=A0A9D3S0B6_ANGAN|nr:hypothetical protein ANANG_G00082950 [Anguilla anguilla]